MGRERVWFSLPGSQLLQIKGGKVKINNLIKLQRNLSYQFKIKKAHKKNLHSNFQTHTCIQYKFGKQIYKKQHQIDLSIKVIIVKLMFLSAR